MGSPAASVLDRGGDQHGQPGAVGGLQLQGHAADLALHAEQRREVGLVVQLAADGEQVGEVPAADEFVPGVPEPAQQRGVDLGDLAVQQRGQVAARRVLVQVLGAVLEQRGEGRIARRRRRATAGARSSRWSRPIVDRERPDRREGRGRGAQMRAVTGRRQRDQGAAGIWACTYAPTSSGAITSLAHCRISVGTVTRARSARLSDRNVVRAKTRAACGSVRQKLLVQLLGRAPGGPGCP
jgi:hypothetical protein